MKFLNMVETAKGLPVVNLMKLEENESIQTIINVTKDQAADHYLFFMTRQGIVKRTNVNEFSNIRQKRSQGL